LPENKGQFGTTTHILPQEGDIIENIKKCYQDVQEGKLPEFPTIEWYLHTTVDSSIQDSECIIIYDYILLCTFWILIDLIFYL
jgi:hypothetical protein